MPQDNLSFVAKSAKFVIPLALVAIGFLMDNPQAVLMGLGNNVGLNLLSTLVDSALKSRSDKWFTKDGALNHDVREALQRAFEGAVQQMQETWVKTAEYNAATGTQTDNTIQILQSLKKQASTLFKEGELSDVLNANKEQLITMVQGQNNAHDVSMNVLKPILDEHLNRNNIPASFRTFLAQHLIPSWLLRFREELKKDTAARTAYENLWQKSMTETYTAIQAQIEQTNEKVDILTETIHSFIVALGRVDPVQFPGIVYPEAIINALNNGILPQLQRIEGKLDSIKDDTTEILGIVKQKLQEQKDEPIEIPPLLPYLIDRTDQERALGEAIEAHYRDNPTRPFVCVVHGDKQQCHTKFCEHTHTTVLPKVLTTDMTSYHIPCPDRQQNYNDWKKTFLYNLSQKILQIPQTPTAEDINGFFTTIPCPVLIYSRVLVNTFNTQNQAHIQHYLNFWQEFPNLQSGQQLLVLLLLQYPVPQGVMNGILERMRFERKKERFLKAFVNCCAILPPLNNVSENHVLDWVEEHKDVLRTHCCQRTNWQKEISTLFKKAKGLPMATVASHLLTLCTTKEASS